MRFFIAGTIIYLSAPFVSLIDWIRGDDRASTKLFKFTDKIECTQRR